MEHNFLQNKKNSLSVPQMTHFEKLLLCGKQNVKIIKTVKLINSFTNSVLDHIETSQLICRANQLTGFYVIEKEWLLMG